MCRGASPQYDEQDGVGNSKMEQLIDGHPLKLATYVATCSYVFSYMQLHSYMQP